MRWLAIDFGEVRVGLALGDTATGLAVPHRTLRRQSDAQVIAEVTAIAREEAVTGLVVGEPLGLDGAAGTAAHRVRGFARKLEAALGLPVELVPETLTSREAETRLREAGLDPRRHRERVDAIAAQILLEEALGRVVRRTP
jgi:putative Holliday junction resolvase